MGITYPISGSILTHTGISEIFFSSKSLWNLLFYDWIIEYSSHVISKFSIQALWVDSSTSFDNYSVCAIPLANAISFLPPHPVFPLLLLLASTCTSIPDDCRSTFHLYNSAFLRHYKHCNDLALIRLASCFFRLADCFQTHPCCWMDLSFITFYCLFLCITPFPIHQ